jgi:hypothetical protein
MSKDQIGGCFQSRARSQKVSGNPVLKNTVFRKTIREVEVATLSQRFGKRQIVELSEHYQESNFEKGWCISLKKRKSKE